MTPLREVPYWWDGLAAEPGDEDRAPWRSRADVAVIGGGYTGLSAARTLAKGGASVVVLERETLGWGASSRNGGQVLTGQKVGTEALCRRFGRERARGIFGASLAAIDFVERLVAEEGIDCGFVRAGHLEAAYKPAHFDAFRETQEFLAREFDHEVRLIPREEQEGELGSAFYHGLLLDPKSAGLHPGRYVRGLAAAAGRAGADLRPRTAVLSLRREGRGFVVETNRGRLESQGVLVATNGYTGTATPALQRRIVPVGSYIVATAPLPRETAQALLPRRRMVFDTKNFLYYFRLSEDDRLLFGGRAQFTPSTSRSTLTSAEILRRAMVDVFPVLEDVPVQYAWSGNVAFTMDLLPHAGQMDGVHFAMGCCGHGIGMSTYLGDVMAEIILGRGDRNPFRDMAFPAIPLYSGRPWFLPLAGAWYKLRDWIQ
ncbi:MAG: NAD(P)/FAD-dependent oxidoreductase [Vicinamibacteria bacterium]